MEKFLHVLNTIPGINYKILANLFKKFQDWRYVWEIAKPEDLSTAGLSGEIIFRIVKARKEIDVEAEMAYIWENDVVILDQKNKEYPESLKRIPAPPFILYRKGAALNDEQKRIAIVGTRRPSAYGEKIAYDLASAISAQGAAIVSGLALGIDAIAHFGAINQKGVTIAVLASGIGEVTPYCHDRFAEKILENNGTIISEYPPCDPAYQGRFLERNRLIAGLSIATIVVEACVKSGALSTAGHALAQKRDLYALCGDINRPQSQGCLQLISKGARPITSIDGILKQLGLSTSSKNRIVLSAAENALIKVLQQEACSFENLLAKTNITPRQINVILSQLELKGLIRRNNELLWEIT